VYRNDRFVKSSNYKYLCFWWIQFWERKGVFRISKSSWSVTSWEKDSFSVWGRHLGLMGSVSTTAFLGGSQVLDIISKALAKVDIIRKTVGEELQVSTMSKRMNAMFDHADAFIALPGGLSTLKEIFHISSWPNWTFTRNL